jgi:hypothetical protein
MVGDECGKSLKKKNIIFQFYKIFWFFSLKFILLSYKRKLWLQKVLYIEGASLFFCWGYTS